MVKQERQTNAIQKGPLWDITSCTIVLEAIVQHPCGCGFKLNEYDKCVATIQSMGDNALSYGM